MLIIGGQGKAPKADAYFTYTESDIISAPDYHVFHLTRPAVAYQSKNSSVIHVHPQGRERGTNT